MAERVTDRSQSARARDAQPRGHVHDPRAPRTDRYEPRTRRTDAEPLEASWRPETPQGPRRRGRGKRVAQQRPSSRFGKLIGLYGWRIYALPVLLVITVIAVFDARGGGSEQAAGEGGAAGGSPTADAPPTVESPSATENPAEPVSLKIPTAVLPRGGDFTRKGKGTWHVVRGATGDTYGKSGTMYKYTIEIEDGLDIASFGGDDAFASTVDATLADPRSWTGDGKVRFQRVDDPSEADFMISLTSPYTAHKPDVCGFQIRYESSCYRRSMDRVVINLARWVRGAKAFNADMTAYRQYAINHEVGHALNNGHVGCPRSDALAPVMMQQTFGVANDYVYALNRADPTNYGKVERDGKVCKPNAWPNPSAG